MTPGIEYIDAVIVGAGFGGLYMLYQLRQLGLSVRVLEQGSGLGGTWYWNRYPGARCDVESLEYSYSFSEELQQDWVWTERYAGQAEILAYLEHVADRFELRPHIQFNTTVTDMQFDEGANNWLTQTTVGRFQSQYCIMATGCLSAPNTPDLKGLDNFAGRTLHTGRWPHDSVDFSNQRVGIIGSGSSAVQSLPVIAQQARQVYLFQRTPNYSVPARNAPLEASQQNRMKARYADFRKQQRATAFAAGPPARDQSAIDATAAEIERNYAQRWERGGLTFIGAFSDLLTNHQANQTAAEYVKAKIRATVRDPDVAEKLCPDHPIGCKRLCSDSGYYEAFNRDNVALVDLNSEPIRNITEHGLRTENKHFKLDMLILATGFDAMTGALNRINIIGRSGQTLKAKWGEGASAYLGIATAGFPNLFLMTGPGSPSVLANMVTGLEQHAEWIAGCIDYLRRNDLDTIEARREEEAQWMHQVQEIAEATLFVSCNSWYVGANIPGKPANFLPYIGGFNTYEAHCNKVAEQQYAEFDLA